MERAFNTVWSALTGGLQYDGQSKNSKLSNHFLFMSFKGLYGTFEYGYSGGILQIDKY